MAMNFAQLLNNSTMSAANKTRALDGVVYQNGYQDTITDAEGKTIANPVTKAQYLNQIFTDFIKNNIKAWEANSAAETARKAKIAEVDAIDLS